MIRFRARPTVNYDKGGIDSDRHTQADFFEDDDPDIFAKADRFELYLADWKRKGGYTYHRVVVRSHGGMSGIVVEPGREIERINFASNNYLGLNRRPEVIEAACNALHDLGSGLCGSRFLSGTHRYVVDLEKELADFESKQDAMVFSTGYQANIGTISALVRPADAVFIDRLAHASIVDGCRLAGCRMCAFRHNDPDHLMVLLERYGPKVRGRLAIFEGVFSMDGDSAPLKDLIRVARQYGCRIMVDEAHGTGVLGKRGRGAAEAQDVHDQVDLILGTFSKALGATGGFVCGDKTIIDYVRHYGRSYIFSASPVPSVIAGVSAALKILRQEPALRETLWANIRYFHRRIGELGLTVYPPEPQSAIVAVLVGADAALRPVARMAFEEGLLVGSAAYPAVPKNQSRMRFGLSASHTRDQLDRSIDVLAAMGRNFPELVRKATGKKTSP